MSDIMDRNEIQDAKGAQREASRDYNKSVAEKDYSNREPRGRSARQADAAAPTPANPAAPTPAPAAPAAPAGPVAPSQASAYGALPQMQGYDAYTQAAMGANPAEAMRLAQAAAAQTAQTQADQAVAQAVKGARTAGAMPGQAALGATGQAANAYGQGLQSGQQQYFDLTKLGASLGSEMSGRLSRAEQTQAGIDTAKMAADAQKEAAKMQAAAAKAQRRQSMFGNIIGAVGGIASLFSDERLKEDIEPDPLTEGLEKIRGYSYKYKGNPREEAGVMAQDLEETNMAPAVMDTPEGKMIDTRRLTTMNTAALADQEGRLKAIEKLLEGIRGIPAPKKAEV